MCHFVSKNQDSSNQKQAISNETNKDEIASNDESQMTKSVKPSQWNNLFFETDDQQ